MPHLKPLEVGAMFWPWYEPGRTLAELKKIGVSCGQLGLAGHHALDAAAWKQALAAEDFTLATVFAAYDGEDYADIPTVERTVGLGDGLNDAGFLRETGSAWLLPSRQTAELTRLVPGARAAPEKGPAGWSQAVEDELAR